MKDIFTGELVRLTSEEPDARTEAEIRWQKDTEFHRLSDDGPIILLSAKGHQKKFEKKAEETPDPGYFPYYVRTLSDDKLIGFLTMRLDFVHRDGWVGIGIGDREFWNRGYGTDMMKICLRYVFTELNLNRLTLGLFDYNPRAFRSYEKAGFRVEGRYRKEILREGKRYDSIIMGILREEWEGMQKENI